MNATPSNLYQLDNIQRKALRIIGVDEATARTQHNIPSLLHSRQVAAASALYKMHTSLCPADLKALLPPPYVRRRATRTSLCMPDHVLLVPAANTFCLDRRFIHTAASVWNCLIDAVVRNITDSGLQPFKSRVHEYLLLHPAL